MYTIVGSCPHCGAPIYSPSSWMGVTPPPSIPSCNCVPHNTTVTTSGTNSTELHDAEIKYIIGIQ